MNSPLSIREGWRTAWIFKFRTCLKVFPGFCLAGPWFGYCSVEPKPFLLSLTVNCDGARSPRGACEPGLERATTNNACKVRKPPSHRRVYESGNMRPPFQPGDAEADADPGE
ncbi:hypothetical protein WJX84_007729 [Apatococcus fuscideae]|uniref:Uncharacterized protein n=1 Tax=Apatococcus fuscideae TaxID=2026836 RepID=A0AAW1T844_9CHLO